VLLASVFAVAAVSGAYLLAQGAGAPRVAEASTETALLAQIATKDSTGDGLPDWEKSLYGIPLTATSTDYFHLGMTDGEAVAKGLIVPVATTPSAPAAQSTVPAASAVVGGVAAPGANSLTDTFAQNFFALYISATQGSGGTLTSDQINSIANQALQQLTASVQPAPDFKTASDIKVAGSGPDALKAYAASAEQIFAANNPNLPEDQLQYLGEYLNNNDPAALAKLKALAASYENTATGLAALTVPSEVAATHLALVNALARLGWQIGDFSRSDSDPLAAMIALQQHSQTVIDVASALQKTADVFSAQQITLTPGTPGASFVNAMRTITKKPAANTP
jgi:hypothetical protein